MSVITPSWQRHDNLLNRCIPSIAAQTYPAIEHVIVSDGPDQALLEKISSLPVYASGLHFNQLPEHPPASGWGTWARLHGIDLAKGEYITYLDDDDAYRPQHAAVLAAALDANPAAGFAYSRMVSHSPGGDMVIGTDPPFYGQIGTPMIMHRRDLLDVATWRYEPGQVSIDWDLVERWLAAGVPYVSVSEATIDVWPSVYW